MKTLYTTIFVTFISLAVHATKWPVTVANFSFSPATVNAVIGDTIQFSWLNGSHTTTCGSALTGTSLPAGAAEWNNPMTSGNPAFNYKVTEPSGG